MIAFPMTHGMGRDGFQTRPYVTAIKLRCIKREISL